jgi:AMMECR1 domain-containing protein
LLIRQHGRRGLLLPQVPVEHGWDRITFLEQTCEKAGLLTDAWKNGATLETFTAEVFSDRDAF